MARPRRAERGGAARAIGGLLAAAVLCLAPGSAHAATLDEMELERWAQLREAERYQLNIAEKYYRESNWKVALSEYEKFLSLYEDSSGAPYAQLKWSLCQVNLRKVNTAIKDGYKSVIDYWPDSPEAIASSYLIAQAFKLMGETKPAKKAYAEVISKHPKHLVAALSRVDLLDIARIEDDAPRRLQLWKELVYDTERAGEAANHCANASRELAVYSFGAGAFDEGRKALATTYPPDQLPYHVAYYAQGPIAALTGQPETRLTGEKVADAAIVWLREQVPADVGDDARKALAKQCWFYMADMHSAARRFEKVPDVYESIIKTYGVDDEILGRFGTWLRSQNRREEARGVYGRFENKVDGLEQIAVTYREEEKYDEAVNVYRRLAVDDQPRAVQWQSLEAYTYREWKKPDEAVAVYSQLLVDDGENANRWQGEIGYTYRYFGRYKEAIAAFRLWDSFPESYIQMAWCHRALGEFKEAISLYLQVMGGHEPSAPWALLQIGYTYEQGGEKENAIKSWQQVCRKFPKTGQASEAHAYLQDKYKITATLGGATAE